MWVVVCFTCNKVRGKVKMVFSFQIACRGKVMDIISGTGGHNLLDPSHFDGLKNQSIICFVVFFLKSMH